MRILFYAVNGLGLGHVTRLLAIARQVRALRKDTEILFITSSEADSIIYKEGFPAIKVPSKTIAGEAGLRARLHARLLQQTAWSVFSAFNPHVTVVDTFPAGFAYELEPVLTWRSSKFVFIYRQRREEKTRAPRFTSILRHYDLVIIPHERDAFGVTPPEGTPHLFAGPILVRSRKELLPAPEAIDTLQLPPGKKYLLITLGGGGQEGLENIIDELLELLKPYPHIYPVVAHGSLMRQFNRKNGGAVLNGYFPLCELYNAFDYVIAGCGYNTVNQLIYFRKPALFLPFERQVDDQQRRAMELAAQGLGVMAEPGNVESMKEGLEKLLNETVYNKIQENLAGKRGRNNARKAAKAILKLK